MDKLTLINFLAIFGGITIIYLAFKIIMSLSVIKLFFTARALDAPIPLMDLVLMKFRKVDTHSVVNAYITLKKENVRINTADLEVADIAVLDLTRITDGLIKAKKQNIEMTIQHIFEGRKKGIDIISKLED